MKIAIVEDEADILKGLKDFLEKSEKKFEAVYALSSAEDAIQTIERYNPEIIITDIVLPHMSGLEMLEIIKTIQYQPKVIIISSFSNFEYAQKSLKLGAVDYILKPFDPQEMLSKIADVAKMIEEEIELNAQLKNQMPYLQLGTETMKEKFLLSLCLHKTPLRDHIYHRLRVWNLLWLVSTSYSLIIIQKSKLVPMPVNDKQIDLETFAIGNIAKEVLSTFQPCSIFPNTHNIWVVVTSANHVDSFVQDLSSKILKFQGISIDVGISERMHSFQGMFMAYAQAQRALRVATLNKDNRIVQFSNRFVESTYDRAGTCDQLGGCILNEDKSEAEPILKHFLNELVSLPEVNNSTDVSTKCFELALDLHAYLTEKINLDTNHLIMGLWERLDRCLTIDEFERSLLLHVQDLSQHVKEQQVKVLGNIYIERAKKIMEERYDDTITLTSVACQLNIHPVWLSKLFKAENGQNFLDFLTSIRIEKAKELLKNTSLRIYEIAIHLGYQDLQYFGKIFKQRTGNTPKEYRFGK